MEPHTKPSIRTGLSNKTKVQHLLKSIPKPAKSKASMPVPEMDMSPDQLGMDNAPGVANGVRRGVGLGNGLRSEANLAKRAARRSPTPTPKSTSTMTVGGQGSVGLGTKKMGDKDQKKEEEEGKVEKGKLGKGAVQVAVQRRSGRNVATASLKPVVEEKAKVVKKRMKGKVDEKGYYRVASDTDGETVEKPRKKSSREAEEWEKVILRDLELLESDGSDLGFKAANNSARKPTIATKTMSKIPAKDKEALAKERTKDTAALAKDTADLGRTTRSSRSAAAAAAAVENGKMAEEDGETESFSVLGKYDERKANEKREIQEKEISSKSTSREPASSKGSQKASDKAGPQVVDDMDCEKEDEWYFRTPFKLARRKPVVYKSAKGKKKDIDMFMNRRIFSLSRSMVYVEDGVKIDRDAYSCTGSNPESKPPPPRAKEKKAVEGAYLPPVESLNHNILTGYKNLYS